MPQISPLTQEALDELFTYLLDLVEFSADQINLILKRAKERNCYVLYEFSEECIIATHPSQYGSLSLNIGFPFPLHTNVCSINSINTSGLTVQIFLRGERIRCHQRLMLKSLMPGPDKNSKWKEIKSIQEFESLANKVFKESKKLIYVDAYTYIGDSIISLYFIDQINKKFGTETIKIHSKAYSHLGAFFDCLPAEPGDLRRTIEESGARTIVMPDLIDIHWAKRLEILESIKDLDLNVVLIGRNIIFKLGSQMVVQHLNKVDPLLRNKNVEDYMDDLLLPFIGSYLPPTRQVPVFYTKDRISILLNAFSSLEGKNFSPEEFFTICSSLINMVPNIIIYVSGGIKGKESDFLWVSKFKKILRVNGRPEFNSNIKILYDTSLTDLAHKSRELKISAVISVDTGIAHMFNRIGILTFTIYKESFWDRESIQSLISDSPIGFARYDPVFYPIVMRLDHDITNFSKLIAECILNMVAISDKKVQKTVEDYEEFVHLVDKLDELRHTNNLPGEKILILHKKISNKFNELKKSKDNQELLWLFNLFDPVYLTNNIITLFPPDRFKYILASAWLLSPIYKYIKYYKKV